MKNRKPKPAAKGGQVKNKARKKMQTSDCNPIPQSSSSAQPLPVVPQEQTTIRSQLQLNEAQNSTRQLESQPPNSAQQEGSEEHPVIGHDNELKTQYVSDLFGKMMNGSNTANAVSSSDSQFKHYQTLYPAFKQVMDKESKVLLNAIAEFQSSHKGLTEPLVTEVDDITEQYDSTVDLLDQLLENVDNALDEVDNPQKDKKLIEMRITQEVGAKKGAATPIRKPQANWSDVDNSNEAFVPSIKEKPNAIVPLKESLVRKPAFDSQMGQTFAYRYGSGQGIGGPILRDSNPHPYEPELFELKLPQQLLIPVAPVKEFKSLKDISCTWVDTPAALLELATVLECSTEFAIDLEHHSYRSFQGFVCLMQISTRSHDYLIDTLELRSLLPILNSSFTNPKIFKVMHGSDSDIVWLQRDFSLYIINLFDTGQASRALNLPSFSLAYLLKFYCSVDTNKKYQLADWRIRPLPSEMVKYARQDTHYLLYIYDRMRNDLLAKPNGLQLMHDVFYQSRDMCLHRYEKERFSEAAYIQALSRCTRQLTNQQADVYRALFKWRDYLARKEDESVRYVLPDHMLFELAERAPTDPQNVVKMCNPTPKLLLKNAKWVAKIIELALCRIFDDDLICGKKSVDDATLKSITPSSFQSFPLGELSKQQQQASFARNPALTTEELYDAAGWLESSGLTPSHLIMDDIMEENVSHGNKHRVSIGLKQSSSLFGGTHEYQGDEDDDVVHAHQMLMIERSFANGSLQSPLHSAKGSTMMAPAPAASLLSTVLPQQLREPDEHSFQTPKTNKKISTLQENCDEDESEMQTPNDEKVPKSLNEIYKLSKKNRKRNKQKKKLKEDSVSDPSPAYFGAATVEETTEPEEEAVDVNQTVDRSFLEKPADFMKKIGWLSQQHK